jgi:N-acetylglucosamine-6-phosphate deacetylase
MTVKALKGAHILTRSGWLDHGALIFDDDRIIDIVPVNRLPDDVDVETLEGGLLVPGFVDVQVNGGGGILFNDSPTVDGLRQMAAAHRRFGTTAMLPTLISDDLDKVAAGIAAVDAAIAANVPGIIGIHLEGPFLNAGKRGVHDAGKFRTLDAAAIDLISSLKNGKTLVTLAPELAPEGSIRALTGRGVIVAAGHTLATADALERACLEGLTGVTHLFNAMSQMEGRNPGVVGATLASDSYFAGLIVDGHHVHATSMRAAYAAKGVDRLMLVTDAMSTIGSVQDHFMLGDVRIRAREGALRAPDGTLAGSAISMIDAVRNATIMMGVDHRAAITMASETPAKFLRQSHIYGSLSLGLRADILHLDTKLDVLGSWIGGRFEAA